MQSNAPSHVVNVPQSMPSGGAPVPQNSTQAQQTILQQSSHPMALIFHLLFRSAAVVVYLFATLFTSNFIFVFVMCMLLLAADFWTVKNVTGRLLVGLRWWSQMKPDGSSDWVFESRQTQNSNQVDSRIFWWSLYGFQAIWILFGIVCVLRFSLQWLLIVFVASSLNAANLAGYTKCDKDAKKKMGSLGGDLVTSMLTSRLTSMFSRS